jgi:predicted phage terminase large subunit-like protein
MSDVLDLDDLDLDGIEASLIRADLLAWCEHALIPLGQAPAAHHKLIIQRLQDLADGKISRLMVLMPPGSAKSTYVSVLFVAWWFARFPRSNVLAASHNGELAEKFGRKVREISRANSTELGYRLSESSAAAGRWETTQGGEYFAAGVGGSITGRRADLAVIDDPVSGREEAERKGSRDRTWDWYRSDLYTRLKPGAKVVLVMTRWHMDDLGGRLLAEEDGWEVLSLPALAGEDDPLGREPGDPLWPEWEDAAALERKRRAVGERDWSALFQQRPQPQAGSIVLSAWWRPWPGPAPQQPDFIVVSLDGAYTAKDSNDPSACTVWCVDADARTRRNRILLRYAWAERLEFPALVEQLAETVEHFGIKYVPLIVLVEAKASGLSVIQELRRRKPDLTIHAVTPRGDKIARAHAVTSLFEAGHVYAMARRDASNEMAFRPWAQKVIDEAASFPLGAHDDLTDSTTMALRYIRDLGVELFKEDEFEDDAPNERAPLFG